MRGKVSLNWAIYLTIIAVSVMARAKSNHVSTEVQVMAPLLLFDPRENLPTEKENEILDSFSQQLLKLKELGVTGVSVDVWWGLVQRQGRSQFDWSYYDKIFKRIKNAGLKIIPILSFHKCGTNVGDGETYISLPDWVQNLLPTLANGMDARYKSELGNWSTEVISAFATVVPRQRGRLHVLDLYEEFMAGFRDRYLSLSNSISEIIVGVGPAGELTYPSYHKQDETLMWDEASRSFVNISIAAYPKRGALQANSPLARTQFKNWLEKKYHSIEALNRGLQTSYSSFESVNTFFDNERFENYINHHPLNSPLARDFFEFYNGVLIQHGLEVASSMATILEGTPLADKILALKTPGVHWSFHNRLALSTAGQYVPGHEEDFGYARTFQKLFSGLVGRHPKTHWKSIFTCADQANCRRHDVEGSGESERLENGAPTHGAFDLVRAVGRVLSRLGIRGGIENSLSHLLWYPQAARRMYSHLESVPAYQSITLLRMNDVLASDVARNFVRQAQTLQKPEPLPNKKLLCADVLNP